MPTIVVYTLDRTLEQKRRLVNGLIKTTAEALEIAPERVNVHIMANTADNIGHHGVFAFDEEEQK